MTFDDTDTHPWYKQPGPIELRHGPHVPEPRPAAGIVIWAGIGLALLIGGYVLARWLGA